MSARTRFRAAPHKLVGGFVVCFFLVVSPPPAEAWGDLAHRLVNARAIANLPEPLRSDFQARGTYWVEHASDPDRLSDTDPNERRHHFTEPEGYEAYPFPNLERQFVEEGLGPTRRELSYGDSIWQIDEYTRRLASAMRRHDWSEVERAAIFAAHYACDLTQPLHTVLNYDGQFTHQAGIHARFESELVKALRAQWKLNPLPPKYETQLRARIYHELLESYSQSSRVFAADRAARARGNYLDPRYWTAFEEGAGPLARERLTAAASLVSSIWYTAWIRAGKPRWPGPQAIPWRPASVPAAR